LHAQIKRLSEVTKCNKKKPEKELTRHTVKNVMKIINKLLKKNHITTKAMF
jgi:hypothetical protein